jgi:hypothetical protein
MSAQSRYADIGREISEVRRGSWAVTPWETAFCWQGLMVLDMETAG